MYIKMKKKWYSEQRNDCDSGYVEYNSVFSGTSAKCDKQNFKGGEITGVFGGIELDLSERN